MRVRLVFFAIALLILGVAVYFLLGGGSGEGSLGVQGPGGDVTASGGSKGGGVGSRIISSAADRVEGRVIDEDGQPLREGSIVLSCLDSDPPGRLLPGGAIRIGEEGQFSGPGCKGRVCAQLRHPMMIQTDSWVLKPGEPKEFSARMLDQLEGRVLDPDGNPVAAANLLMVAPPGDEDPTALPPFVSRNASTDVDGRFAFSRLERPPCDPCADAAGRCDEGQRIELPTYSTMLLTARAEGFRMVETLVDAADVGPLELRLAPPEAPLTGELRDPDGNAYPRARILARSLERNYEQHSIEPETEVFSFDDLGDGSYELRAIQDGVELATHASARGGDHVVLAGSVSARGPDLVVKVFGVDGQALVDALVDGGPMTGARTDRDGIVRASDVMPGPYTLRVRGTGVRAFSRRITVPDADDTVSIELRPQ